MIVDNGATSTDLFKPRILFNTSLTISNISVRHMMLAVDLGAYCDVLLKELERPVIVRSSSYKSIDILSNKCATPVARATRETGGIRTPLRVLLRGGGDALPLPLVNSRET